MSSRHSPYKHSLAWFRVVLGSLVLAGFYACASGTALDEETSGGAGKGAGGQSVAVSKGAAGKAVTPPASGGGGGAAGTGSAVAAGELCGDGFDNNGNGVVDEGCTCTAGTTQGCFPGPPAQVGAGKGCTKGTQTCGGTGEIVRSWGPCTGFVGPKAEACNQIDDDCDGQIDEDNVCAECTEAQQEPCNVNGCTGSRVCQGGRWGACAVQTVQIQVRVDGDCTTSTPACPACAPYPVGCNLDFGGGTKAGCVVLQGSTVYTKEGTSCDAGRVTGTITCGITPTPLNAQNCPINKPPGSDVRYPTSPDDCPD